MAGKLLLFFFFAISLLRAQAYDISDSEKGASYKNIAVISISPNGAVIMHSEGWAEISFDSLDEKLVEKLKKNAKEQFPNGLKITDLNGIEYKKACISCVEEDGITIEHSRGTTFVLFKDLPEEWRKTSGIVNNANDEAEKPANKNANAPNPMASEKPKPINIDLKEEELKKQLSDNQQKSRSCREKIKRLKKALDNYPRKIYLKLISDKTLEAQFRQYKIEKKDLDKNLSETREKYSEVKRMMGSHIDLSKKRSIKERIGWRYETDPLHTVREMDELENRDKTKRIRYIYPEEKNGIDKTKEILNTNNEYTQTRNKIKQLKKKQESLKDRFRELRHLYKQNLKKDLQALEEELIKLKKEISQIKSKLSENS